MRERDRDRERERTRAGEPFDDAHTCAQKKAMMMEKTKTRFLFRLNNDDNNNNRRATKAKRTSWRAFARGIPGTP